MIVSVVHMNLSRQGHIQHVYTSLLLVLVLVQDVYKSWLLVFVQHVRHDVIPSNTERTPCVVCTLNNFSYVL